MAEIPESLVYLFAFAFGAILGSFGNVVIYRLPKGESVVTPRSHCYNCKKPVSWYDNIPIFTWLILRGRCRHCKAPFSIRYMVVEVLMAIVFTALVYKDGITWTLLEHWVFAFALIVSSFIDFDHMILPDEFTLSGIVIGLVGAALNPDRQFMPAFWGVILGGGFLWATAAIYALIRKAEGMGGGDIKLLAWIGAVLGWTSVPFVIIVSSLVGSLVGILMILRNKGKMSHAIPFGPYLALGALLYIFFGHWLAKAYIQLFIPSMG